MAEYVVAAVIDADDRNYEERVRFRLTRRIQPLQHICAFNLAERKFRKTYRVPNSSAQYLCEMLSGHPHFNECDNIPKHLKILASLHFYTNGGYQAADGGDSLLGLSQSSMCRALEETTNAIVDVLAPIYIKFPTTLEEKAETMREFHEMYNMPNVLGAVDGTHVAIFKPPMNDPVAPGLIFYNRKGFYSINCQVVTNARGRITSLNPNFPGSTHDAAVWSASAVARHLEREFLRGEEDQWLLGDKGYPLLPWLMIPVSAPATAAEENYNSRHTDARNVVEMSFGRLKNKFRCLHRHRTLHYTPTKAAKIIIAVSTLYNMFFDVLSDSEDEDDDDDDDDGDSHGEVVDNDSAVDENPDYLAMARAKRDTLIQSFR